MSDCAEAGGGGGDGGGEGTQGGNVTIAEHSSRSIHWSPGGVSVGHDCIVLRGRGLINRGTARWSDSVLPRKMVVSRRRVWASSLIFTHPCGAFVQETNWSNPPELPTDLF